ncbi:MAG: hypothetical protein QNK37_14245 [Acidobacteriota bacterium]|nr:hypothetical protein [Acidobacteriota bacterium]
MSTVTQTDGPVIHHLRFKASMNPDHRVVAIYLTPTLERTRELTRGNIKLKRLGVDKPTDLEVVSVTARESRVEVMKPRDNSADAGDPVVMLARRQGRKTRQRFDAGASTEAPVNVVHEDGTVIEITLHKQDSNTGELTVYELILQGIEGLQPPHDRARFSLKSLEAVTASSKPQQRDKIELGFEIDYLSRDFNSLTRFLYEQMSRLIPDWKEQHIPDQGVALVELLAYAADYFSYYQDAVATEAYLETAHRRISVRRHARLLDYRLHEGCSARAWVHLETSERPYELAVGARFVGGGADARSPLLEADTFAYRRAVETDLPFFESLHSETLYPSHNRIGIFTWGKADYALKKGATSTILMGRLYLRRGDVIIFEERISPETGREADANTRRRHAVRLHKIERYYPEIPREEISTDILEKIERDNLQNLDEDELQEKLTEIIEEQSARAPAGDPMYRVTWHARDALPFDMPVSMQDGAITRQDITVARGNMVLVQHGRREEGIELGVVPATEEFRPQLPPLDLSYHVPYRHTTGEVQSAVDIMTLDPVNAMPSIELIQMRPETDILVSKWAPDWDLMSRRPFDRTFVVESDWEHSLTLRFGNGIQGWKPEPGHRFFANLFRGSGARGNVGHDTINRLVVDKDHRFSEGQILNVRNPLPAKGGHEPEDVERARRFAPEAFHSPRRCVTADDYAQLAGSLPEVNKAVARIRWTGCWETVHLLVDRNGGFPISESFKARMTTWLRPYCMAGHDLEIGPPEEVALDIALLVSVKNGYAGNAIRQTLLEILANGYLEDGSPAYFHPDRWTFGQPVYLSPILAEVMRVPGVSWIQPQTFARMDGSDPTSIKSGKIKIGELEVARLDNNPMQPHFGSLTIETVGGI